MLMLADAYADADAGADWVFFTLFPNYTVWCNYTIQCKIINVLHWLV